MSSLSPPPHSPKSTFRFKGKEEGELNPGAEQCFRSPREARDSKSSEGPDSLPVIRTPGQHFPGLQEV